MGPRPAALPPLPGLSGLPPKLASLAVSIRTEAAARRNRDGPSKPRAQPHLVLPGGVAPQRLAPQRAPQDAAAVGHQVLLRVRRLVVLFPPAAAHRPPPGPELSTPRDHGTEATSAPT